jgi:tellurite resistance protein
MHASDAMDGFRRLLRKRRRTERSVSYAERTPSRLVLDVRSALAENACRQPARDFGTIGAMHSQDKAMLKSLVAVAWADGRFADEEHEMLEALLNGFDASEQEANEIREYAKTPRTIDDIPLDELSADDKKLLLNHAVVLTYIDGQQSDDEKKLIESLVKKLGIWADEAEEIITSATKRAERLLQYR